MTQIYTDYNYYEPICEISLTKRLKPALLLDFHHFLCYNFYVIRIYKTKYIYANERM